MARGLASGIRPRVEFEIMNPPTRTATHHVYRAIPVFTRWHGNGFLHTGETEILPYTIRARGGDITILYSRFRVNAFDCSVTSFSLFDTTLTQQGDQLWLHSPGPSNGVSEIPMGYGNPGDTIIAENTTSRFLTRTFVPRTVSSSAVAVQIAGDSRPLNPNMLQWRPAPTGTFDDALADGANFIWCDTSHPTDNCTNGYLVPGLNSGWSMPDIAVR